MMEAILKHNQAFVEKGGYSHFPHNKYPLRKLAILTCMDTRLVELLPSALGIGNGDVVMIKNAGGLVSNQLDTVIRSILIAVLELGVKEVMVIGHTDCGVHAITPQSIEEILVKRGISPETIRGQKEQGLDFDQWFQGFENLEGSVVKSVYLLRTHPLMPLDIRFYGFVLDVETGELRRVCLP